MRRRLRIEIRGAVQGVGFRPFVFRLAAEHGLAGWVVNDARGVVTEVEGEEPVLQRFAARLESEKPNPAVIQKTSREWLEPAGFRSFRIEHSDELGPKTVQMLPDIATCDACRLEVLDAADRRHGYPFTNCTHCGPRFSIILALPYDRPHTTMERFAMCPACRTEYEDPADRRFHAQPNACPECGPRLSCRDAENDLASEGAHALRVAVGALERGEIVAVKGLGGFHLMVDARNAEAVERLRERKPRRDKPFALMFRDAEQISTQCHLDDDARLALASPAAPILLLRRRRRADVPESVAPGNPHLGVMLPHTPLHHLLLDAAGFPVVATSGNLSDEPICIDEQEARTRLGGIAERFLVHDRPIARHVDDSVMWVLDGEPRMIRRARGYAPRPVLLDEEMPTVLAVGAHLKNAIALSIGRQVFISQHIGDMETPEAINAFERVIADLLRLYEATPVAIAHDLHPDYVTTQWARAAAAGLSSSSGDAKAGAFPNVAGVRLIPVQHHHAHLAACLAENSVAGPALGVSWDGTGYGTDATVWGGEFLQGTAARFERVAHLRSFRLPGGEAAIEEPRRSALALLWETFGPAGLARGDLEPVRAFGTRELALFREMLQRGINSPVTTSAGRLFDGVAALVGLHQTVSFEGQAAMALEFEVDPHEIDAYPIEVSDVDPALVLDWRPLVASVIDDHSRGVRRGVIAARFHNALVGAIVRVAREVGEPRVALSGGCFQNRRLTEGAVLALREAGFEVLLHRQVPPNDGGICLGQVAVAAALLTGNDDMSNERGPATL